MELIYIGRYKVGSGTNIGVETSVALSRIRCLTFVSKRAISQLFSLVKQPSEIIIGIAVDFTDKLAPYERIATFNVTTKGSLQVVDSWVDGNYVLASIKGGIDSENCKLTYIVNGSYGQVLENDVHVSVVDD